MKHMLAAALCLTGCAPAPRPTTEVTHWAVYYDDAMLAKSFAHLDLVVFDRRHHPKFDELKGKTKVLAYVSIGEVYDDVPEKKMLEKKNALLYQNDKWGSHAVDVTSAEWRELVLGYVADADKKGFDGVMLDTIDSPLHWAETKEKERLGEMQAGAIRLIKEIRRQYPKMKIMVNRGFAILPQIAKDIDFVLAESIYTKTDDSTGQFDLVSPMTYAQVAGQLRGATAIARQLQVFTLDYWKPDDVKGLERIYAAQRAEGFVPYVTTPDLRSLTPIPHEKPDKT
jgi:uncharacterized protein (TIGR01370 family)